MDNPGDDIYPNKTRRYLLPVLKDYGQDFINKFNQIFKTAVGIGDFVVEESGIEWQRHLFILIDSSKSHKFFLKFMKWIIAQDYYEDDYIYGNIQKSNLHMLVLKIPEKFYKSLEAFKTSRYSAMYDEDTIKHLFNNSPNTQKVFIKDHNYKIEFIKKVNQDFETNIDDFDNDFQLDYPFDKEEEQF